MKVRCNLGHRRVPFLSPAAPFLILLAALFLALPGYCGPIHDAARDGNLARVKALLKSNPVLLESRDDAGETPLHWAAFWGRVEVADFLIAKGAELHARDHAGRIPLDYAIAHGRDEMVVLLRHHDPAAQMASISGVAVIPAGDSAPASRAVQPAASEAVPAPAPVPAKAPDAAPGAAPPTSAPTVPEAAAVRPAPEPEAAPAPVPVVPAPAPAETTPVPAAAPVAPAKESSAAQPVPQEAVPAKAPGATSAPTPPAPAPPAAATAVLAPAKAAPTVPAPPASATAVLAPAKAAPSVPAPPAPAATVQPALPQAVPAPVIVPGKAPEAAPASTSPAPGPAAALAVRESPAVREALPVVLAFSLPVEVGSTTAWTRVRVDFPKPAPQALLIRLGAPLYEAQMAGMLGQRGGIEPVLWTDGAELVIGSTISAPPDPLPSGENSGTLNSLLESGNGTVKTSLNGVGWPAFVAQVEGAVAGPSGKPAALLTGGALLSENMLGNLSFDSDPSFPLTFRLVRNQGLVYLCGRGTVIVQGIQHAYGQHAASTDWGTRLLKGKNVLEREGAAQSIGWLRDKKFLQPLIEAMANPKEDLMVWRSAIEAAGRIHDAGAVSALETLSFDRDPRLSAIARWSLKQIDLAR